MNNLALSQKKRNWSEETSRFSTQKGLHKTLWDSAKRISLNIESVLRRRMILLVRLTMLWISLARTSISPYLATVVISVLNMHRMLHGNALVCMSHSAEWVCVKLLQNMNKERYILVTISAFSAFQLNSTVPLLLCSALLQVLLQLEESVVCYYQCMHSCLVVH